MIDGDFDSLATGRSESLFEHDVKERARAIRERVGGARLLIVGGAGTIGASTLACLLEYEPSAVDVVDISENGLAELVRELRSRAGGLQIRNLRCLPIDYGSPLMERLLVESPAYDLVLNFAALKHVRSEKDVFSLMQMLDTNLVKQLRFKGWLDARGRPPRYFAVSTDKAANPVSMMGASKRLMEDLVFSGSGESTSARFANVAFSNGSLLQSWLYRISKRQPLAVPRDTKRYFVSVRESGQICLLAASCASAGHILFPSLNQAEHLVRLEDVAAAVVAKSGFEPCFTDNEELARRTIAAEVAARRYPIVLTPLDTSGEKPYEEFVARGEQTIDVGFRALSAIPHVAPLADVAELIGGIERLIGDPRATASKADLVSRFRAILPVFDHVETGRHLDQKM